MKVKTSITLEKATLREVDSLAGKTSNRSRVIETAILDFVRRRRNRLRDERDAEIINRNADALNREAMDVLEYQVES